MATRLPSPMPSHVADWPRALVLMDEALALGASQREAWLTALAAQDPAAAALLRKLLAAHVRVQAHELLATLPKLHPDTRNTDSGIPGLHVGPFELIEPLGRGGMGSVWRARYADGRLKRDVAVKLPASASDPAVVASLRERFARERDYLAALEHPHIARLYDAGVSDSGQLFLAMEYVAGQPIDLHCDAQRLGVKARLSLYLQVLDAVGHAHQQLVLHRDLKPGNVLVDEHHQVRLLDFGVATLLPSTELAGEPATTSHASLTERAGAAFTLRYAAPEQMAHKPLSTATDTYALGVMLFELLTGTSPYEPSRDTRGALEDAVLLATPALASMRAFSDATLAARQTTAPALRKALRHDLDVILAKALKKNPKERYATVGELADDLRRHLAKQPISARPDSWAYRSERFVARHRAAVAASVLAVLVLALTTGTAVWQAHSSALNAERAAREANRANTAQKFFSALFANADPEKNMNITAMDRQIVDRAVLSAEKDFASDPGTLALVFKQLGDIYFRLGVYPQTLALRQKSYALMQAMPGATVNERVDAGLDLGAAYGYSAKPEELAQATPILLASYELATTANPASAERVVKALCQIADSYLASAKFKEASEYAERAVAHAERFLPSPHADRAFAYEMRGLTAARLGQFEIALAALHQAAAMDATGQARSKSSQLIVRINLANTEFLAGHYTSAVREAVSGIEFAQREFGKMDGTLTTLGFRAVVASERAGMLDDAETYLQRYLADDLNSAEPFRAGRAQLAKGQVASARGDMALAQRAFSAAEAGLGRSPVWGPALAVQQATWHLRQGQSEAALELLQPLLGRLIEGGRKATDDYSRASDRAGVAWARLGQLDKAQSLFQAACERPRAMLQANHPDRVRCESYLLLIAPPTSRADTARALKAQLTNLTQGRSERFALAISLQNLLSQVDGRDSSAWPPKHFPLLN